MTEYEFLQRIGAIRRIAGWPKIDAKGYAEMKKKNNLQLWQRPINEWNSVCQNLIEHDGFLDLYEKSLSLGKSKDIKEQNETLDDYYTLWSIFTGIILFVIVSVGILSEYDFAYAGKNKCFYVRFICRTFLLTIAASLAVASWVTELTWTTKSKETTEGNLFAHFWPLKTYEECSSSDFATAVRLS